MALLNRDAILKSQDAETKDIPVPAWGGSIRVRTMTVAERNEFVRRTASEDKTHVAAWLVALLAIDEAGSPLFKPEDVTALEERNFKALDSVVAAILVINGTDPKKIEEAEKK